MTLNPTMSKLSTTISSAPTAAKPHRTAPTTTTTTGKSDTYKQNFITNFFRKAKPPPPPSSTSRPETPRNQLRQTNTTQRLDPCGAIRPDLPITNDTQSPSRPPVRSLQTTLPIILSPKVCRISDMTASVPRIQSPVLLRRGGVWVRGQKESIVSSRSSSPLSDIDMEDMKGFDDLDVHVTGLSSRPSSRQTNGMEAATSTVAEGNSPDPVASSPVSSPRLIERKTYTDDMIIQASDNDDSDDSNDSFIFMPLSAILPTAPANTKSPTTFPSANTSGKRLAVASVMSTKAKRVRLDWDDLIASAEADQISNARMKKAQERYNKSAQGILSHQLSGRMDVVNDGDLKIDLKKSLKAVIQDNQDAPHIEKVVRAVERTDVSAVNNHVWRFFQEESNAVIRNPPVFPVNKINTIIPGFKKSLQKGDRAEDKFRLDYLLARISHDKTAASPDVFKWLMESCITHSSQTHARASKCLTAFYPVINRLSPEFLQDYMERLGAKPEVFTNNSKLQLTRQSRDQHYEHRNWNSLRFVLSTVANLADYMSEETLVATGVMLLKMGADMELMAVTVVQPVYFGALMAVFGKLDCDVVGSQAVNMAKILLTNFQSMTILLSILRSMPIAHFNLSNLRRRLAIAFLFNDSHLAGKHPQNVFALKEALEYLNRPVFQVGIHTDYRHVRSLIALFDLAIDDGCMPPSTEDPGYDALQRNMLLEVFNEDLDAVIYKLKAISRAINDVNMGSMHPAETKGQIDILLDRLQHTVRHGGAVKLNIYGTKFVQKHGKLKWAALVKSGQAKEKGQVSITSFAKVPKKTINGEDKDTSSAENNKPLQPTLSLSSDSYMQPNFLDSIEPPTTFTTSTRRKRNLPSTP